MAISNTKKLIEKSLQEAYESAEKKNATIPVKKNIVNLKTTIDSIKAEASGGEEGGYERPADWLPIPELDGTKDEIYLLNGVGVGGFNKIAFEAQTRNGEAIIDWGDGTTDTITTTATTFSHNWNYEDVAESSYTEHNKTRQVLIHIVGDRNSISFFNLSVSVSYTNADGITVTMTTSASNNLYEVKADVESCSCYCCSGNYYYLRNLEIFDWKGQLNNTSFRNMFQYCYSLQSIPQLDTSKGTRFDYMFSYCYSLQSIPQLDLTSGTNFSNMFQYCYSLRTIPQLDMQNGTSFNAMFYYCYSLQSVSQLDTSSGTNFNNMFTYCHSLQSIQQLDTSNNINFTSMFQYCYSLQSIPQLDTSKGTNFASMFSGCYSLQSIPQLDTSSGRNFGTMFQNCYSLQSIPQLDLSSGINFSNMFYYCYSLQSLLSLYNAGASTQSSITLSDLTSSKYITKQKILDLINSLAPNINSLTRTLKLGSTLQGYVADTYCKDSGVADTYSLPTGDITASWNKYVLCESTDEGAMLVLDYARNVKGWTIS